MNSDVKCPTCGGETPLKYNFCQHCNQQVKCLNTKCNQMLVFGQDICLGCGRSIFQKVSSSIQSNKYVRRVKQCGEDYEEYTEFNVSDHAVTKLAPYLAEQYMSNSLQSQYSPKSAKSTNKKQELTVIDNSLTSETNPLLTAATASSTDNIDNDETGVLNYFEHDENFLIAKIKDFKGKTWGRQQINFIILYTAAYCQYFKCPVPSKEHLKAAAEKSHIIDSTNFTKYLKQFCSQFVIETSDGLKLNKDGEKEANNIIANIQDNKVSQGKEYWLKNLKSTTKICRFTQEDKTKVQEWVNQDVDLGKLNINEIKKSRDYVMVALWIITIHLGKVKKVRWNEAYHYLKEKYETISTTSQAFSRAMKSRNNEKYFRKTDDAYYLSRLFRT